MTDINLIIDIDCYECGKNISIPFRLGIQQIACQYCIECGQGVFVDGKGIDQSGTLSIEFLSKED